jgi:hypothetical protein
MCYVKEHSSRATKMEPMAKVMTLADIKTRLLVLKAEVDGLKKTFAEVASRQRLVTISTELREIAKQITQHSVSSTESYKQLNFNRGNLIE